MMKCHIAQTKKLLLCSICIVSILCCSGCFFTKLASVPLRIVGAVTSIVPAAGNSVHDAIDSAADTVDELPF